MSLQRSALRKGNNEYLKVHGGGGGGEYETRIKVKDYKIFYDPRCDTFMDLLLSFASELVGTAAFIFLATGAIYSFFFVTGEPSNPSVVDEETFVVAIAFGLALTAAFNATNCISGGGLNPVVTFVAMFMGKLTVVRAIIYTIAQLVGGILGSAFVLSITPGYIKAYTDYEKYAGCTILNSNLSLGFGVWVETLLTFIFTLVIALTVIDPIDKGMKTESHNFFRSLIPGVTLSALMLVGYPLTGCSLNPARSLGPAIIASYYSNFGIYWAGPYAGACITVVVYWVLLLFMIDKRRDFVYGNDRIEIRAKNPEAGNN